MKNYKTGIITALISSNEIIPQFVTQFDDAETGSRAKQKVDHNNPIIRAEAAAASVTETVDNNRIGTISDWVSVLWSRVAENHPNYIKSLDENKLIKQLGDILKADAQVNLSIDFAKKRPDMEGVEWLKGKRNGLESEAHKHAGKLDPRATKELGRNYFYPSIPKEEGDIGGKWGIPAMIHNTLKDIPDTKGLKVAGYSYSNYEVFEEEEHTEVAKECFEKASWGTTAQLKEIDRDELTERINQLASKFEGKIAEKLGTLAAKVMRKKTLTNTKASATEVINIVKDLFDTAHNELPIQNFYDIIGLLIDPSNPEAAWKAASDLDLNRFAKGTNRPFVAGRDESLSDSLLGYKRMLRFWGKSWANAEKENAEKPEETKEAENAADAILANLSQEELDKLDKMMDEGF